MALELERLVYCSRSLVRTESLLVIAEILSVSQRNNDRDGLTGALAISPGWFLQVIEGDGQTLDSLLRRLSADARHTDIEILARSRVTKRLFDGWTMASARITPGLDQELVALVDQCRVSPDKAVAALVRIVRLGRQDAGS